jgi:hypothetical protein
MTILLLATLFMTLAAAIGSEVLTAQRNTRTRLSNSKARYAAYAGLQHAMLELKEEPTFSDNLVAYLIPGSETVSYTVQITNNCNNNSEVQAHDGTMVPPNSVYCTAMGVDDGQTEVALHAMSGLLATRNPQVNYAAFTETGTELTGSSQALSFHSGTSTIDTSSGRAVLADADVGNNGSIGSNREVCTAASSTVRGDVYRPEDQAGNDATNLLGALAPGKSIMDLASPVDVPKFSAPGPGPGSPGNGNSEQDLQAEPLDISASITLTAPPEGQTQSFPATEIDEQATLTLPPGRYYFPDGLSIEGSIVPSTEVNADNPIIIYVGGSGVTMGEGARVNLGGAPANFQMYFVDQPNQDPEFRMQGDSQFFGTVIGNRVNGVLAEEAELFGGFLGRSISASGNARLIYDEALQDEDLDLAANWGLSGVTEPQPDVLMSAISIFSEIPVTNTYVHEVRTHTINYNTSYAVPYQAGQSS